MFHTNELTTADIKTIFAGEIEAAGGTISDTFDDGARLFVRSLLPWVTGVRPRDQVQGGVALRAVGPELCVHPYIFRQVCRNGAIMATTLASHHIDHFDELMPAEAESAIRLAVQECCQEDAFTKAAERMRSSRDAAADAILTLLPHLARWPRGAQGRVLEQFAHVAFSGTGVPQTVGRTAPIFELILREFETNRDRSRFGLGNAITAVARDTRDPEMRWRLEELGGGVLVGSLPVAGLGGSAAALALTWDESRAERRRPTTNLAAR